MTKKTIAIVAALCLTLAGIQGIAGTVYADTEASAAQTERELPAAYTNDDSGGYLEQESDRNVPKAPDRKTADQEFNKGGYPAVYPSGGIQSIRMMYPPTRSQSPYGTCWAHAVAACADFDMVKNHGKTAYTFDVSELQLAYYTYHPAIDRLGYLNGDVNRIASGAKDNFLDMGGNSDRSMRTLAQWKGFTYESNIPYSSAANVLSYGLSAGNAYRNDAAKLEKAYIVDVKENQNAVKEAVMQYGAVAISYEYELKYYNKNTY